MSRLTFIHVAVVRWWAPWCSPTPPHPLSQQVTALPLSMVLATNPASFVPRRGSFSIINPRRSMHYPVSYTATCPKRKTFSTYYTYYTYLLYFYTYLQLLCDRRSSCGSEEKKARQRPSLSNRVTLGLVRDRTTCGVIRGTSIRTAFLDSRHYRLSNGELSKNNYNYI